VRSTIRGFRTGLWDNPAGSEEPGLLQVREMEVREWMGQAFEVLTH
jgi:hypothetical protein